jgi:hypothetical protein
MIVASCAWQASLNTNPSSRWTSTRWALVISPITRPGRMPGRYVQRFSMALSEGNEIGSQSASRRRAAVRKPEAMDG